MPEERPNPAFDGLLEERKQLIDETTASETADDDMRDLHNPGAAVKNEYLEIASYEALIQLARKLDLPMSVRDTLDQNFDEEQQTKKQLKALGEDSTVTEIFARLAGEHVDPLGEIGFAREASSRSTPGPLRVKPVTTDAQSRRDA